jgi:uncharacterized protein
MKALFRDLPHIAMIMAGAVLCGYLAWWLHFPLPWMLGAMIFAGAVRLADWPIRVPVQTRQLGQTLVASSVGLSFTPEALRVMGALALPMIAAAVLTILIAFAVARLLSRLTGIAPVSAILATLPLGPVESAVLARKFGVAAGPVVFSQTMRIVTIVALIPPIIVFLDGSVVDAVAVLRRTEWTATGAGLLLALGLVGAAVANRFGVPNPYFLGALGGASLGAVIGLPVSAFPYVFLAGAQVFLGIWLGAAIDRDLFRNAHTLIPGMMLTALIMIVLCAAMGLAFTQVTGQSWQVMILATAPGSVTEMALTAKILQDGLALVTAFHLVRIFIIIPFSRLIVAQGVRIFWRL